jgi:hypothetical protein
VRPFHATMGAVAFLQGPMGNANGQLLRLKKETGIFTDLCSYFRSRSLELHLTTRTCWSYHKIICRELTALHLPVSQKGDVSPDALAHALMRTSLPQNSMQQRIQGAAVRVGDEGWLYESGRSRAFFCLLVEFLGVFFASSSSCDSRL